MRTDVKIGVIAAFVLVAVGVWFFVFRDKGAQQPAPPPPVVKQEEKPKNVVTADRSRTDTGRTTPAVGAGTGTGAATGTDVAHTSPGSTGTGTGTGTAERARPWWEEIPARTAASAPASPRTVTGTGTGTGTVTSTVTGTGTGTPAATPDSGTTATSTYKVKSGDTYWSIAKEKYGDATLHTVLEAANKNTPANRLGEGLTITIPPKPAARIAASDTRTPAAGSADAASGTSTAEGSTGIDQASGKKYYIVKKGDKGLWDVAKAYLGDGRLYTQIEAANPGVSTIKPGQKLWLPQSAATGAEAHRPVVAIAPAPRATSTGVSVTPSRTGSSSWGTGAPAKSTLPGGREFD